MARWNRTSWTQIGGRDSFGPWAMQVSDSPGCFTCPVCSKPVNSRLHYWRVELPVGVPVERTILKKPQQWIGVSCGCWAKFVRQVVHIAESGLRKGYPL